MIDEVKLDAHMTEAEKWSVALTAFEQLRVEAGAVNQRLNRVEKEILDLYARLSTFVQIAQAVTSEVCQLLEKSNGK